MLSAWLSPLSLDEFSAAHLGRAPYARPSAATDALPLFDWDVLDRIFSSFSSLHAPPDVLVAADGRLADVSAPRSCADVRRLMAGNRGVVIRKAERHDRRLAELADAFARDLRGDVHVQLYITPVGTQTFGWHFDDEEVFIAQTVGSKDYYLRENTVVLAESARGRPDFSAVRREKSPLLCVRLIAGDWLYIPARWWHLVRSVEDALSISIGVTRKRAPVLRSVGTP